MSLAIHPLKVFVLLILLLLAQAVAVAPVAAEPSDPKLANDRCLRCHGREGFSREAPDGSQWDLHVSADVFESSVHGERDCVGCHQDITKVPHRKGMERGVGCVQCHMETWGEVQAEGKTEENGTLSLVVDHIESYMQSLHARPRIDDQSRTNATCYDCHGSHDIKRVDREARSENYLNLPNMCGKCHGDILELYKTSVHGREWAAGNTQAAICADCHSRHGVGRVHDDEGRVAVTASCGNCHKDSLATYSSTYHGKVTRLGYGNTAKCYDCHGSHQIQQLEDPASQMHVDNRLETCQKCHEGATAGFVTFQPHGTTHDREKYPQMWFASTGMIGLLIGTFAFFWLHSALWFYREWKDRKEGKNRPHVVLEDLPAELQGKTSVLYADSSWAPYVMGFLGGPETAGYIHRVAALGFIGVFFIHLTYFAIRIGRTWRTFEWFGPNSLVPSWQDLKDATAMFRWFFGLAPRPSMDRFTYWEKFDYWAPFWGMTIIGVSGVIMWLPEKAATFLPGWVFNVAQIVHGEEAFLAAVFLFTVHFFNNHFRPDKFPQDTTMFTGRVPIEVYKHEHRREYDRLLASGELEKYLVDAPTVPQAQTASMLGATLIMIGLFLLTLVITGFLGL
jgi:cytochrome b subunit of formate dehydrogenase/cytochrome c553